MSVRDLVHTPWTNEQMIATLAEQLAARMAGWPSKELLGIFWAKCTTECGRNGKSCWNFNVGNVRGTFNGQFIVLKNAYEKRPDGTVYYPPNQQFRAYDSFDAGVGDMLDRLSQQPNFALAWQVLTGPNPTPEAYVHAAKAGHYFTEDEHIYAACVVGCYREAMRWTDFDWPTEGSRPIPRIDLTFDDSLAWHPKTAEQVLAEFEV